MAKDSTRSPNVQARRRRAGHVDCVIPSFGGPEPFQQFMTRTLVPVALDEPTSLLQERLQKLSHRELVLHAMLATMTIHRLLQERGEVQ